MVEHGQALSIKFSFPSFPRPRSRADRYSAEINTRGEEELSVVACSDGERICTGRGAWGEVHGERCEYSRNVFAGYLYLVLLYLDIVVVLLV